MANNIDKIGEQVRDGLNDIGKQSDKLRPMLKQIWDAFDEATKNKTPITINGCTKKEQWAAWSGQSIRNIQHILRGKRDRKKKDEANHGSLGIGVSLQGFTLEKNYAWVSLEIEAKRDLPYLGKRRDNNDYSHGDPTTDPTAEWTHTIKDVYGKVDITVENEDGTLDTDKKLVAALYEKMQTTLKSIHLWRDGLKQEFEEFVKDDIERQEEQKERRSASAKKAAETRKAAASETVLKEFMAARAHMREMSNAAELLPSDAAAQNKWDEAVAAFTSIRKKAEKLGLVRFDKRNKKLVVVGEEPIKGVRHLGTHGKRKTSLCGFVKLGNRNVANSTFPVTCEGCITIKDAIHSFPSGGYFTRCGLEGVCNAPDDQVTCPVCLEEIGELSEPAKALAAAVDGVVVPKICPDPPKVIDGIPQTPAERKALLAKLIYDREHPWIDPNAGDEFAGECD